MTDLLELAARCEAAEGPDREFDLSIAKALGLRASHLQFIPGGSDLAWDAKGGGCGFKVERYSASLDAATQLLPEGCDWMADNFDGPHDRRCSATVYPWGGRAEGYEAYAATPALALVAAALRARGSAYA